MNPNRLPVCLVLAAASLLAHVAPAQVPSMLNYQGRVSVGSTNFHGTGQFKFALVDGGVDQSEQATATAQTFMGTVLGVFVVNGGAGYTSPPSVQIGNAFTSGSGAVAIAQVSGGVVTGITVTAGGSGYPSSPPVTIDPPPPDIAFTSYWSNDGTSVNGSEPTTAVTLPVERGLYSVFLGDDSLPNMAPISAALVNNPDLRLRVWFNDGVSGFQQLAPDQRLASVAYALQAADVPDGAITGDKLAPGAITAGLAADGQRAVPQGALVLSETAANANFAAAGYVNIGTVQTGNTWEETNPFVPPETRSDYSMVWTGNELIVWGGVTSGVPLSVGRRHNPTNNFWSAISDVNAPQARSQHTAVWTGTEMIIWGGSFSAVELPLNTGARYNPASNSWTPMSTNNAPSGRRGHTAIWTGSEMIVWGGGQSTFEQFNDGARYNPATDTWAPLPAVGSPGARWNHTAVWTGNEMLVWGGLSGVSGLNTGGRYNALNNTWASITTANTPTSRQGHTAVWTGNEMVIWGGISGSSPLITGGRYDPVANTWVSGGTTTANAPTEREKHFAFWTGSRMIVWGGRTGTTHFNTGGAYSPVDNTWSPISLEGAPQFSTTHTAVWTGNEMRVWGAPGESPRLWTYRPGRVLYLFQGL